MSRVAAGGPAPDESAAAAARARQASLTKPPGSLGVLEDIAVRFAAWQGRERPEPLRPAITVFAADHGVAAEGVSAFPVEVTAQMVRNFAAGGAAICVLARANGARLEVVDVGVAADLADVEGASLVHAKVRAATDNLRRGPAMSTADAARALDVGREAARRAVGAGANVVVAGEMGIGNTTASAALIGRLTGADPAAVVGRGTGVDDGVLALKRRVVGDALARVAGRELDGVQLLAELGGLEIAAMCGYYLEAADRGVPAILDGFIAAAAALVARAIQPGVVRWLMASHRSDEAGHQLALAALGLPPLLDLRLRLGEGSGAALCLPLLQQALRVHAEMATFAQAGISDRRP